MKIRMRELDFLRISVIGFYFFLRINVHVGLFTVMSMSRANTGNPSNPWYGPE